ncbi:MAG: hydantoinase/oxoprolinase family protein [Alphaproteobacteria bacterium]|nr:hydantoinase/oxoprolinase family protein [Alphaproteobacteria bacterium]
MLRLAFDIGGTFTDCVLHDPATGVVHALKLPTTPADPAEGVLKGLDALLLQANATPGMIGAVLHATTIATNAVIERKGAATALITTRGFRDVLIIGRQKRYEIYDLFVDKAEPLIRRRHIHEVDERIGADGQVIDPLDAASVDRAIDAVLKGGAKSVAVALLHSYANPAHEQAIARRWAERALHIPVSISSDISPKYREYERTNTAVVNAYVRPVVDRYLARLQGSLKERGFRHELFIMQSNGGLVSPILARRYPVRILESGPAAGVLMASMIGASVGAEHVITFDMGGTTAKLGAVDGGVPAIAPSFEIDSVKYKKGSGLPISTPAIELLEIGAGGGSIASLEMGLITVGPESAGADPGPICYGRGGRRPTVTDANVVLGYIDPGYFNGGTMSLDAAAAAAGIAAHIGAPLGLATGDAAWGVHLVANSNMEHAMRLVSVERGRDPRHYAIVAFGGAGPLHAARLARAIGVPKVIVPVAAGVGSAVGLLRAAPRIDVTATRVLRLDSDVSPVIRDLYARLEARAGEELSLLGDAPGVIWTRYGYMRYAGQGFEIHVDLPGGPIGDDFAARAAQAFRDAYARKHGHRDDGAAVEAVDWVLVATLRRGSDERWRFAAADRKRRSRRSAWFPEAGGYTDVPVLSRAALAAAGALAGPAIVEDADSSVVVLPGDTVSVDPNGHVIIAIATGSH